MLSKDKAKEKVLQRVRKKYEPEVDEPFGLW